MINSLLPIYNILIPYIISTIFIKYLGKEYIFISFQIIVIFYYNYISIFNYSKRIKFIIYQILYILLIINIICEEKIKKHVPKPIQPVFMSYAGIQGSEVYNSFIQNKLIYKSATFKKPK